MNDKFFKLDTCERCGGKLDVRIMSVMNQDTIRIDCKEKEKQHPRYEEAREAENQEVLKGNYNYPGLFAGQKYPFGYEEKISCSAPDCNIRHECVMSTIDDGKEKIALCATHALGYGLGYIKYEELIKYPSSLIEAPKCEICGKEGVVFKDMDAEFFLCKEHLHKLLVRHLEPDEFFVLNKKAENAYIIHDDFYDPDTGEAIQPAE